MDDNAANCQEPDHHSHDLFQTDRILPYHSIDCDLTEKVDTEVQIENGRDANRPKEPHIRSLLYFLNLRDVPVEGKHNRNASE